MNHAALNLPELVRSVVDSHRHTRGPLIEILHDIQRRLLQIDPEVVPLLAAELNLSRADVHRVVSFYRDFRSEPARTQTLKIWLALAPGEQFGDQPPRVTPPPRRLVVSHFRRSASVSRRPTVRADTDFPAEPHPRVESDRQARQNRQRWKGSRATMAGASGVLAVKPDEL